MPKWLDVSLKLVPGMAVWPGDPPFESVPEASIGDGDSCNLTRLSLSTHLGTHLDAPWHFCPNGLRVDELDPELFFGQALVVEVMEADLIRAGHLPAAPLPPRVLFKTRNSLRPEDAPFDTDFVAVAPDAAARLVAEGVRLVGVDGYSVGAHGDTGPTHRILLGAGIPVVEGLRLGEVPAGPCEFVVLPLPIAGGDGAPCRAFLRPLPGKETP